MDGTCVLTRLLLLMLIQYIHRILRCMALDHIGQGDVVVKKICTVCNGNGFVKVPYSEAREEVWADCEFCKNQGEIEVEVEDDTVRKVEH